MRKTLLPPEEAPKMGKSNQIKNKTRGPSDTAKKTVQKKGEKVNPYLPANP